MVCFGFSLWTTEHGTLRDSFGPDVSRQDGRLNSQFCQVKSELNCWQKRFHPRLYRGFLLTSCGATKGERVLIKESRRFLLSSVSLSFSYLSDFLCFCELILLFSKKMLKKCNYLEVREVMDVKWKIKCFRKVKTFSFILWGLNKL